MEEHSRFSPSSASRWLRCPGSIQQEERFPDKGSRYAAEGTAAHQLAYVCLQDGKEVDSFLGKVIGGFTVDKAMAEYVQDYIDYVRSHKGHKFYEQKLELDRWLPGQWGTADVVNIFRSTLRVIDLKYGKGVAVSAVDNDQLKLYALGALDMFSFLRDFKRVELCIHQPRLDSVSEWSLSVEELLDFGKMVRAKLNEALRPGALLVPGDIQCRFCRAKDACPAIRKMTEDVLMSSFEDEPLRLHEEEALSEEAILRVLRYSGMIKSWLSAIEKKVYQKILSGEVVPGWKLVAGRSSRVWKDEEVAEALLISTLGKDKAFESKLLSVPKAYKVLGKKKADEILKDEVEKKAGKPTLVPETDKRPALECGVVEAFEDLSEEEEGE